MTLAIPTAVFGAFLVIIVVCPYKDEISLHNA
jgi:hypothetical protein